MNKFAVYVGGSAFPRFVGAFETYEEAKAKADTCISKIVFILDKDGEVI
tara:strand:+ start:240 stop:386 length:147 start_codon:yes stop_codon:yes gene_type:complete